MINFNTVDLLLVAIVFVIVTGIFLIFFGQFTVKKFRKNPNISPYLGVSLMSGWDIMNVASALSLPIWFLNKISNDFGIGLNGNYRILRENANKLDFILARVFFYCLYINGIFILTIMILDYFNIVQ